MESGYIRSMTRPTRAATLAVVVVSVALYSGRAVASCWASNPGGNRICGSFAGQSGLVLQLCEDQAGDCERAGYVPAAQGQDGAEPAPTDETGTTSSPTNPSKRRHLQASDSSTDQSSQQDDPSGFLIIVGVLIAVVLFGRMAGLDAGTSILIFVASFIAGLLSSGRRRRW